MNNRSCLLLLTSLVFLAPASELYATAQTCQEAISAPRTGEPPSNPSFESIVQELKALLNQRDLGEPTSAHSQTISQLLAAKKLELEHKYGKEWMVQIFEALRAQLETKPKVSAALAPTVREANPVVRQGRLVLLDKPLFLRELDAHYGWAYFGAFSPQGDLLITGGSDNKVRLWDARTGVLKAVLEGHGGTVYDGMFAPNGKYFTTISFRDGKAFIWSVEDERVVFSLNITGSNLLGLKSNTGEWLRSMAYSHSGEMVALGVATNQILIFSTRTGQRIQRLKAPDHGPLYDLAFSPDDKLLVTTGKESTPVLWNLKTGKVIMELEGHSGRVRTVDYSSDGRWIVSAGTDKDIKLWDASTGKCLFDFKDSGGQIQSVQFSHSSKYILSADTTGSVKLWSVQNRNLVLEIEGHRAQLQSARFSPDDQFVVVASTTGKVRLWQIFRQLTLNEFIQADAL